MRADRIDGLDQGWAVVSALTGEIFCRYAWKYQADCAAVALADEGETVEVVREVYPGR